MSTRTVVHNYYWDRDQPDGSTCIQCTDMCLLTMWRLVIRTGEKRRPTNDVLCDSCHRAMMEADDD